ncbi:MAG TPA: hypothetical protein VFG51_00710 [Candidatus Saccharimonadia bacterium]|nr:hypothetical protein [Candidatus Saccharimonadia bacterium]
MIHSGPMHTLQIHLYCIALLAFLFLAPRAVFANDVLFQDDFSSGNMSNWTVTQNFLWDDRSVTCQYSTGPAFWEVFLERLGMKIAGPPCYSEVVAKNLQLPAHGGFAFSFDMAMPTSVAQDRDYAFRVISDTTAYSVHIFGSELHFYKVIDGVIQPLDGVVRNYPFQPNQTYHIRNEVRADHTIHVFVNDQEVFNIIDNASFPDGGTVGFRASVGAVSSSEVWFDNILVTALPDHTDSLLDVPYFSQRDPLWSAELYDSALDWANHDATTIDRWGCALTSAVMMLRFHHIIEISPGVDLTPSTLNTWLQVQLDGYIGDGLVNWIAITRLVHEFHQRHTDIPELEYAYGDFNVGTIADQASAQNPTIIELPKHFVLGRGFSNTTGRALLHDPYDSSHIELDPDISHPISLRLFTPSFTDLRYILVTNDPGVEIHLLDGANESQHFIESIDDDVEPDDPHSLELHQIAKPHDGTYTLTVRADSPRPFSASIFFYHGDGSVQRELLSGTATNAQKTYAITYSSTTTSTIAISSSAFLDLLLREYTNHEISSAYIYYRLKKIGEDLLHRQQDDNARIRYIALLKKEIETHSAFFSPQSQIDLETAAMQP